MHHTYKPLRDRPELIALRDRSGLTQPQLAAEVGVSFSSWQKYEYGQRTPRKPVQAKINALMIKYPA